MHGEAHTRSYTRSANTEDEHKLLTIEVKTKILTKKSITFNPIRFVSFQIFCVFFFFFLFSSAHRIEFDLDVGFGAGADVVCITHLPQQATCMCVFAVREFYYFITTNFDFQHSPIEIAMYSVSSCDSNSICGKNHGERARKIFVFGWLFFLPVSTSSFFICSRLFYFSL